MANIGEQLLAPESGWKRFDDTNVNINYIGTWTEYIQDGTYNGGFKYANGSVNKIKFNFVSDKIRILSNMYNNRSNQVAIKIDGTEYIYSEYNTVVVNQALAFETISLQLKEHSCEIYCLDEGRITIDAIDVDENGELRPYDTLQNTRIISEDSISIYPNIYVNKENQLKVDIQVPLVETTVMDNVNVAQSTLESGNLFETDYIDLMKYNSVTNLDFSSN